MILCFDISTGGVSSAMFSPEFDLLKAVRIPWGLHQAGSNALRFTADLVVERCKQAIHEMAIEEPPASLCIGSFMHNCVLLDKENKPLTPVLAWNDPEDDAGIEAIRVHFGDRFFELTGCRFYPMYPIFKLAALRQRDPELIRQTRQVASIKALLMQRLTGVWSEDHGMASASGLCNVRGADWEPALLDVLGLGLKNVPRIFSRNHTVGLVTRAAALEFGLPEKVPVINGSGDGFLASVGSDCEVAGRLSMTLGTSAAARRTLPNPVLDRSSGTFCYRGSEDSFILGCASSNGGNVLDWGRSMFGDSSVVNAAERSTPIFVPFLHGERSVEWNPRLTGSWHDLTARHTAADLKRSIIEGVIFNLASFVEILQQTLGEGAKEIVLSGRGFLDRYTAPLLATVLGTPVFIPADPGTMSLRGAAVCAQRALGGDVPPLSTTLVAPLEITHIFDRYERFKEIRDSSIRKDTEH